MTILIIPTKNNDENNGQVARESQYGQGHGNVEKNIELNHGAIEFYLEWQQKKRWHAISKQLNSFLHHLQNTSVQTVTTAVCSCRSSSKARPESSERSPNKSIKEKGTWCSDYHYGTTFFIKDWAQFLRRLKFWLLHVGNSR